METFEGLIRNMDKNWIWSEFRFRQNREDAEETSPKKKVKDPHTDLEVKTKKKLCVLRVRSHPESESPNMTKEESFTYKN